MDFSYALCFGCYDSGCYSRSGFFFWRKNERKKSLFLLWEWWRFWFFIKNERIIIFHKKQKEKDQRKINQTVKDLVESYSYIGEVNRKMDILMSIALDFRKNPTWTKKAKMTYTNQLLAQPAFWWNLIMLACGSLIPKPTKRYENFRMRQQIFLSRTKSWLKWRRMFISNNVGIASWFPPAR